MSRNDQWDRPGDKRYVPQSMMLDPQEGRARRRTNRAGVREDINRQEPYRRRRAHGAVHRCERLTRSGRAARTVFAVSLSLLIVIVVSITVIYVYLDSRILSRISYVGDAQTAIPANISDIVIEDDGDAGMGETMMEEDARQLEKTIEKGLVADGELYSEAGVINVLLLGTDGRQNNAGVARSDAMILLSINRNSEQIVMTSFMRDMCVNISGRTRLDKLNAANAYGGAALAMDTIEANFGVRIDRYISINFYAFMDVIDTLGGLTLDVNEDERRVMNSYIEQINGLLGLNSSSGKLYSTGKGLSLTGKQVLGYVRNRYTGNGDFERTERQRTVLEMLIEKCRSADGTTLLNAMEAAAPYMITDYDKSELIDLACSALEYKSYTVVKTRLPVNNTWQYVMLDGMSMISFDVAANRRELIRSVYGK